MPAGVKISALTAITPNVADADLIEISVSSGGGYVSRKCTFQEFYQSIPKTLTVAVSDETTALTTGSAKLKFRAPTAMVITDIRASLNGAGSTSGTTTIDINETAVSILSTKLTIDYGEQTSVTAATPLVISDANIADNAEITIDIDAVTGGADETGLKITFYYTEA